MKKLMINRRTTTGWLDSKTPNVDKKYCDVCLRQLWVAPDMKTVYCNTENCGGDYVYLTAKRK